MGHRDVGEGRHGEARGGSGKLTERAEHEWGEAGELAEAQERTERNLRKRAEREGRVYVPTLPPPPPRPRLLRENEDAWELFAACSSQLILGGWGGLAGVDHTTLKDKMDVREIPHEERYELEQKFIHLEHIFTRHWNARASSKSKD